MFWVRRSAARFDRHHHDCDEYWLIYQGKAKILTEGEQFYVRPGDLVCTQAGQEHDVLEIYEDLAAFYYEDALIPGGRPGHLHRDEAARQGHDVAALQLPDDFPQD